MKRLGIPKAMLPEVLPSSHIFGETDPAIFGGVSIPVAGIAGDQQAALFGQACFEPGMTKVTYGTGAFLLMNTGKEAFASEKGLLTSVAWGLGDEITYCLEGSIFIAGAAVQWLRDGLGFIGTAEESELLAQSVPDNGGVYFVPALVGLGAPYWDMHARGMIIGLTRGSSKGHIVRAALEAMAYQTRDVIDCMKEDSRIRLRELRVDGGAREKRPTAPIPIGYPGRQGLASGDGRNHGPWGRPTWRGSASVYWGRYGRHRIQVEPRPGLRTENAGRTTGSAVRQLAKSRGEGPSTGLRITAILGPSANQTLYFFRIDLVVFDLVAPRIRSVVPEGLRGPWTGCPGWTSGRR